MQYEDYGQESDIDMAKYELENNVDDLDKEGKTELQIPLPNIVGGEQDRENLREQIEDKTLSKWGGWANDSGKGFAWDDGLLVNYMDTPTNIIWKRTVVPKGTCC